MKWFRAGRHGVHGTHTGQNFVWEMVPEATPTPAIELHRSDWLPVRFVAERLDTKARPQAAFFGVLWPVSLVNTLLGRVLVEVEQVSIWIFHCKLP